MEINLINENTPWYKQFWPWFILSPLIIVIFAGFWMLYTAIVTNDGVIIDNFYKDGLGIEVRTEQDSVARDLGLKGDLRWAGQDLQLSLSGVMTGYPDQLSFLVVYPTKSSRDIKVILEHQGAGLYSGQMTEKTSGTRQLQLEPVTESGDSMWRLHAKAVVPPLSSQLVLLPKTE
ncbi:MAG: hypothetical protein ACI9DO_001646 [Reinekea sp.]